jgi:putative peptide zinc metalloprotease protein
MAEHRRKAVTTAAATTEALSDSVRETLRYPKLRSDLIIAQQKRHYGNRYTIKVPDTERYFQLGEDEYTIIRLMDGRRSLSELLATLEQHCGLDVDARTLWSFIKLLHKAQCLDLPSVHRHNASSKKRKNPLRNALYLDRHVFNPDPLLSLLEPKLRFLFSQAFLWFTTAMFLVGLSIVVSQSQRVTFELASLGSVSGFVSLYLAAAGVTVLHEFAHGLTCKHYGGKVPSMGMLLILLTFPCFYTDVSDTWLFEKKRHRIAVTAAGVVFESLIWSIATALWLVTAPDALIHQLCLGVMISSGAGMLLSLNPLIKFDGYYLLSDLLDIPNLRNKAMAYFSIWLGACISGRRDNLPSVSQRDHRVFVIYGLAVIAFTFFILGSVVYMLSSYAVEQFGPLFLVPVGYLFWMLLGSTIKGIWTGMSATNDQHQASTLNTTVTPLAPVPEPAASTEGEQAKRSDSSQTPPRRYTRYLLLLLLLSVVAASHFVSGPLEISGQARLKPVAAQSIEPSIHGLIKAVHVREGQTVQEGQALLKIEDEGLLAELKSAEADLLSARKELVLLENGTRPQALAAKRAELTILQANVVYNREHYERLQRLPNSIAKTQLLEAKHLWESAMKKVQVARSELALLVAGTAIEEIEAKRASITALEVKTQTLEQNLNNTVLNAPISGLIVTKEPERLIGKYTSQGSAVLDIEQAGAFKAQISIKERDVAELKLGQPVRLKVYSYPDREFYGEVVHIAATVDMALIDSLETSVIRVDAAIDDPDQLLKSGMNGLARISGDEYTWLELALRKITHWFRIEFWL